MLYTTLKSLFEAICNAIREKKGTSASINHQDIPEEILSISSGGTDTSDSNALPDYVLIDIVYYGPDGRTTGTMPNQSGFYATIDGINEESVLIPKGYHDGTKSVSLTDDISNEVSTQDQLISEISSILDEKSNAYPEITFDESTKTLTITEVS